MADTQHGNYATEDVNDSDLDITTCLPTSSFPKVETPHEERIGGGIEGGFRTLLDHSCF